MKKWHLIGRAIEPHPDQSEGVQEFYLASDADSRIAELERENARLLLVAERVAELEHVLRAECIYDVGQRDPKWYCQACGNCGGATLESIEHQSDCEVARVLGL